MKIHPLITTTEELTDLCVRLAQGDYVCVDTEVMRENTYYPMLCLVQLGNEEEAAAPACVRVRLVAPPAGMATVSWVGARTRPDISPTPTVPMPLPSGSF